MAVTLKEDKPYANKIQPHLAVSLLGWVRKVSGTTHEMVTDPWGDEWVTFDATDVILQIPGSERPDKRSVVWLKRDAQVIQHRSWIAGDFAQHETLLVRGGGGGSGGGAPAPPGDKKPPG